ncbi:hypothetical protein, partial [Ahrensia sp. R2A130]|uniref:beta strand repeat-containing protein n=1 Tax=Ahrensia sp. R2A130 TaxID=744979 RepID=UPI0001E0E8A7
TGGNYNTDEDTAVALTGLTGALTDTDGSETLTYRVTGVDPAASFTTGTDAGGGVWTFTKAELDAGLTYNPPPQADGTFNMVLEATATEDEGDTATNTANIIVTVASVSDAPTLTTGASAIDEDQPAAVGASLTYASTDPDGSEVISEVAITDIPAGSVTDFTVSGAAVVTPVPGGFTITGPEADIRATVASLTVTPPAHSADDFVLQIAVTVMDGLDTATTTGTHPVTVTPVADTPILTGGTINGDEDTPVPLTVLAGTTPDMDGSETIAFQISGVPAGTSLSVGTDLGGGVWALTPAELDIVAFNPATNFSGTVPLVLSATTTDSNGDTATANTPFDVVIEAQADAPTVVPGSSTINEDTPGLIGDVMTYGLVDTDGSEVISGVVVDGAPAGTVFGFTASGAVVVTLVAGGVSISGTEAEIRATLDTLTLQAPDDTGDDIALNVAVTTTDDDGSTATTNATHNVDVVPVVDTPDVTGGAFTTDEDTTVLLTGVAALLTDTDGSESIVHTISGVPTGASFTTGTDLGGGNWSFTPAELAAGITFTPPVDEAAVTYNLTISATSTEAEGGSATASAPITITIDPVADPATLNTGTTTATEDNGVIAFGADITVAGNDTDNSESMSLELSGLPPTGTVSWNTGLPGTVTLGAPGTYTIAGTPQEVAAILATFGVEPATHDAFDFNVGIAVTTTDGTDTTTVNGTHAVTITAVADAPVVTGGSSSVDEDVTTVFGADISYALVDTDGSEVVSQVAVTGIPAGADITFTPAGGATVTAVAGGYTITGPEADIRATLDTFAYDPADDDDTNVQLTVEVTTTDDGGSTASTTDTHDLIVAAVADAPSGSGSGTGNEDTAIAVPVTTQLNDTDGSETITQAVVTAPTGVVLGGFGPSGATVVQAGQDWTITGTPAQIDAALAAMTATPPNNSDADFNLSVTLTATETSPVGGEITTATADTTFTVPVTVTAVADAPNVVVPGAPIPTEEDTAVAVGAALGGSLNDTDGSETISY